MNKFLAIACVSLLLTTSCKKNDNPSSTQFSNERDAEKIAAFFDKNARKKESFTVNITDGGEIVTAKGTKLNFSPGSITTKSGNPVSGNINIKVLDVFEVQDMILNNKPTITVEGEQLISYGEIIVEAEQGGEALAINRRANNGVRVAFPIGIDDVGGGADGGDRKEIPLWEGTNVDTSLLLITGYNHENQTTSITQEFYSYPGLTWDNIPGFGAATANETSFMLDELGAWRNCDVLVNDPRPKTTVLCYLGEFFNNQTGTNYTGMEPSSVFFKLKGENTLVKLYDVIMNPISGKEGFLSYQNTFSVGSEGSFLAISSKNDKFYAQLKENVTITPATGKSFFGIQFDMQEVSESQLLALINDMKNK